MKRLDRFLRILLASAMLASVGVAVSTPAKAASDSAIQVNWNDGSRDSASVFFDQFKDFSVRVSQTQNLTNQGITVRWSGLAASNPSEFSTNYVQIMQCWGGGDHALPENCQWGAPTSSVESLMGSFTANRDLIRGEDPSQTYNSANLIPPPEDQPYLRSYRVPFKPVNAASTFNYLQYFDSSSTNEISAARTGQDGTGQAVFEVQTTFEAPHLGCGANTETGPRSCWLVVVPRGENFANGDGVLSGDRLGGSPLTATNWDQRIEIKLGFAQLSLTCKLGNSERRVVGHEMVSAAFTSWQPALCQDTATFGFSQIGDGEARRQIISESMGASGLAFISRPYNEEELGENKVVYGPIVESALVVAFNIDRNYKPSSALYAKNGTLVDQLVLNPRLLAKLLTQSYRADVPGGNVRDYLKSNPRSIVTDPEFQSLNPEFADFANTAEPGGLVVSLGGSDINNQLWRWLQNDVKAKAFLSGEADEWGMKVNPAYQALGLATDDSTESFPKADLSYYRPNQLTPEPGYGTLDLRPYASEMLEAALMARRGDPKAKITWDQGKNPPSFVSNGAQPMGQRFMLAVTDLAAARRYGLQVAKLINPSGEAVLPTDVAIRAGIAAMPKDEFSGQLVYDPAKLTADAYPLASLTYAAVNPCRQDEAVLADYRSLLNFAIGAGQTQGEQIGQLPSGFVPLTTGLKAETEKMIQALEPAAVAKLCAVAPTPTPTPSPTTDGSDGGYVDPGTWIDPGTGEPAVTDPPVITNFATQGAVDGPARVIVLAAGLFGIPALMAGRFLLFWIRRKKQSKS